MKKINLKIITLLAGVIMASGAFADNVGNTNGGGTAAGAQSGSQSGALAGNGNGAGNGGVGNNYSQTYAPAANLSNAVGNAYAPALTTTLTETCMGSTSVGAGFSGGSFSFGTTWRDHACVRRLDAREIKSFGDIQAAKEIMCDSDLVREAFKRVGRPCAEDGGSYVAVSQPAPAPMPTSTASIPAEPAPMATEKRVHDEQDSSTQSSAQILKKADEAREVIRTKYGF